MTKFLSTGLRLDMFCGKIKGMLVRPDNLEYRLLQKMRTDRFTSLTLSMKV